MGRFVRTESLPTTKSMSSRSLTCRVSEEREAMARELVAEMHDMLTNMEKSILAELGQLRNDFERLRAGNLRHIVGESNVTQMTSQSFASPHTLSPTFAVAENRLYDEIESHSFELLSGQSECNNEHHSVVPTESINRRPKSASGTVARKSVDTGWQSAPNPLGSSLLQVEAMHSDCVSIEISCGAGTPMDRQVALNESDELLIGQVGSECIDPNVTEQKGLVPSDKAIEHSRRMGLRLITSDREMIATGSSMSECESAVVSQTSLQQAFTEKVLVLWAVLPSRLPVLNMLWYHFGSKLMGFLGLVGAVSLTVLEPVLFYEHMSLLVLSLGVIIGLPSIRNAQVLIGPSINPFGLYATRNKITAKVASASFRNVALFSLVWPTTMSLHILKDVLWKHICDHNETCGQPRVTILVALHSFSYIFVCGFFTAMMVCLIHLMTAIEVMINEFMSKFFFNPESKPNDIIRDWNHIDCLLRRTARKVDTAFVAVMTSASIAVMLHVVRCVELGQEISSGKVFDGFTDPKVVKLVAMVPTLVLFGGSLYCLAKAAHLNELCKRLPSLLNALAIDSNPDDRNCIVQFVAMSNAGFHIKGVRLSASFILKVFYILGGIVFGAMTRLMSMLSE